MTSPSADESDLREIGGRRTCSGDVAAVERVPQLRPRRALRGQRMFAERAGSIQKATSGKGQVTGRPRRNRRATRNGVNT
jgi:hypothetical protein